MDDVELDAERDSVFDVVLALFTINYSCDENGERFVKISDVRRIIDDLVNEGAKNPEIHDYDMPDLNPSYIIQNDYVDYVALDEEIASLADAVPTAETMLFARRSTLLIGAETSVVCKTLIVWFALTRIPSAVVGTAGSLTESIVSPSSPSSPSSPFISV